MSVSRRHPGYNLEVKFTCLGSRAEQNSLWRRSKDSALVRNPQERLTVLRTVRHQRKSARSFHQPLLWLVPPLALDLARQLQRRLSLHSHERHCHGLALSRFVSASMNLTSCCSYTAWIVPLSCRWQRHVSWHDSILQATLGPLVNRLGPTVHFTLGFSANLTVCDRA